MKTGSRTTMTVLLTGITLVSSALGQSDNTRGGSVSPSSIAGFGTAPSGGERGGQVSMPFATISSTGGVVFDDGSFAILGQPFVGVTRNSEYTMIVGALAALVTPPPPIRPPLTALPPHDILKNRYISIDPRGAGQTNPSSLYIRVSIDSTQVNGLTGSGPWWAAQSNAACISVVTTTKPAVEPDWTGCNTAHLTGCPIIPTTTYALAAESGGVLSADALFDTQARPGLIKWHGDAVGFFDENIDEWTAPNLVVNADDFLAAIKTFQDPNAGNAAHVSVVDMVPGQNGEQINVLININDVFSIIKGFQGGEWNEGEGGPDLTQCP